MLIWAYVYNKQGTSERETEWHETQQSEGGKLSWRAHAQFPSSLYSVNKQKSFMHQLIHKLYCSWTN